MSATPPELGREGRADIAARRVLIVGAGVAGLALARALHQRGVAAEVVGRVAEWQPIGAGLYLPGNATRALHELGIARSHPAPIRSPVNASSTTGVVYCYADINTNDPAGLGSRTGVSRSPTSPTPSHVCSSL